jgi:hypothetical protein
LKNVTITIVFIILVLVSFNLQAAPVAPTDTSPSILEGLGTLFSAFNLGILANQRYEIETGFIQAGYNDVSVPGTGSRFSLTKDLKAEQTFHFRYRLIQPLAVRHRLIFTYAPMKITSKGNFDNADIPGDLYFAEMMMPADMLPGREFQATYRLDSYRQSYMFDILKMPTSSLGLGLSVEIRDEAIAMQSGDYMGKRSDNKVIFLGNFSVTHQINPRMNFLAEGDIVLDAKDRTADIYLGVNWKILKDSKFKVGYRVIQRTTDTADLYNKAMFHFLTAGIDLNP